MCGETVLTIDGRRKPFDGFTTIDKIRFDNTMLITDIDAFTNGDEILGKWIDINRQDWLLAIQGVNGVSLVIKDKMPITVCKGYRAEPEIMPRVNNVRSINSKGVRG